MKISNDWTLTSVVSLLLVSSQVFAFGDVEVDRSPCTFVNKGEIAKGAQVKLRCPSLPNEAIKNLEKLIQEQMGVITENLEEQTKSLQKVNRFNDMLSEQVEVLESQLSQIQQERDKALTENKLSQQNDPSSPLLIAEQEALESYDLKKAAELREEYYQALKSEKQAKIKAMQTELAREAFVSAERWESAFNLSRALMLYQEAVEFKTDYPQAWRKVSLVAKRLGETQLALQAARRLKKQLNPEISPKWYAIAIADEADLLVKSGNNSEAFKFYLELQQHLSKFVEAEPENTEWQRDLSVSHNKVGDMHKANGDGVSALKAYEDGLAIAKKLAELNPKIVQWQTDLVVSYYKLSEARPENAHDLLTEALVILKRLHGEGRLDHQKQQWISILENVIEQ